MIKAVIFDFDGILIDSEPAWYNAQNSLLQKYGKSFTLKEYVALCAGRTVRDVAGILVREFNLPVSQQEALAVILEYAKDNNKTVPLKKGAKELISYLSDNNYRISLGTSSTRKRVDDILNHHGLLDKFDSFITFESVKKGKPDPEVFLKGAESLGLKPEECLVLEDAKMGVEAAYNGNLPVIFIPDLRQPDEYVLDKAAAVLESLNDVIDYLNTNNH